MSEANQRPMVVGIGELLWDCLPDGRQPGGAPANVAFHAGQLGGHGVICSRVGRDDSGRGLLDELAARGLDLCLVATDPRHPTGRVTVDDTIPDAPTYLIHENAAWDHLEFDARTEGVMKRAAAVCFGTLAQRSPQSRETVHRCLDATAGALVVYDVNLRPPWYERPWIERSLDRCDIAKLNAEEAGVLAAMFELPAADLPAVGRALAARFNLTMTCITRAEAGCLLVTPELTIDQPGVPVAVVDAVGAGDAFTAALISASLGRWPLEAVAEFACGVGALVATRRGAMPALGDELAALHARLTP